MSTSRNKSRSPHRSRKSKTPPTSTFQGDDEDIAAVFDGLSMSPHTVHYPGDENIRHAGGHTLRIYRASANDKADDPEFSIQVIKSRINLTQANLLAAGNADNLVQLTHATMKNSGSRYNKKKKPAIVVTIPTCDEEYNLGMANQVQPFEDHKFDMHSPDLHQQEKADILALRREKGPFLVDHVIELPLFQNDSGHYEDISNEKFNDEDGKPPADEFALKVVFTIPNSIPAVVTGTRARNIQIGFVTVLACVKGTLNELKQRVVTANAFDDENDEWFGGAADAEDQGQDRFPRRNEERIRRIWEQAMQRRRQAEEDQARLAEQQHEAEERRRRQAEEDQARLAEQQHEAEARRRRQAEEDQARLAEQQQQHEAEERRRRQAEEEQARLAEQQQQQQQQHEAEERRRRQAEAEEAQARLVEQQQHDGKRRQQQALAKYLGEDEMDTSEAYTEGLDTSNNKKAKIEKQRGMTSLAAAVTRRLETAAETADDIVATLLADDCIDIRDL